MSASIHKIYANFPPLEIEAAVGKIVTYVLGGDHGPGKGWYRPGESLEENMFRAMSAIVDGVRREQITWAYPGNDDSHLVIAFQKCIMEMTGKAQCDLKLSDADEKHRYTGSSAGDFVVKKKTKTVIGGNALPGADNDSETEK